MRRKKDPGTLAMMILRLLEREPRTLDAIQAALGTFSSAHVATTVERLKKQGYIGFRWRKYRLTKQGRDTLPAVGSLIASQGHWKPEPVVLRAGCEIHRTLPSMRGGALHYREQA